MKRGGVHVVRKEKPLPPAKPPARPPEPSGVRVPGSTGSPNGMVCPGR